MVQKPPVLLLAIQPGSQKPPKHNTGALAIRIIKKVRGIDVIIRYLPLAETKLWNI